MNAKNISHLCAKMKKFKKNVRNTNFVLVKIKLKFLPKLVRNNDI